MSYTDPLVVAVAQCSGLKKAPLGFKWGCCFNRRVANVAQVPCSLHLTLLHDCVNFPWLVKLFLVGKRMSFPAMATTSQTDILSMRKQPTFGDVTTGFPAKWRLRNGGRNSILITRHYPDLGSDASSVLNFSYVISRGNQWWRREMSAVFFRLKYFEEIWNTDVLFE